MLWVYRILDRYAPAGSGRSSEILWNASTHFAACLSGSSKMNFVWPYHTHKLDDGGTRESCWGEGWGTVSTDHIRPFGSSSRAVIVNLSRGIVPLIFPVSPISGISS